MAEPRSRRGAARAGADEHRGRAAIGAARERLDGRRARRDRDARGRGRRRDHHRRSRRRARRARRSDDSGNDDGERVGLVLDVELLGVADVVAVDLIRERLAAADEDAGADRGGGRRPGGARGTGPIRIADAAPPSSVSASSARNAVSASGRSRPASGAIVSGRRPRNVYGSVLETIAKRAPSITSPVSSSRSSRVRVPSSRKKTSNAAATCSGCEK